MEDFALDIVIGKGPSARTLRLDLPPFTIVGATTRIGLLSNPLRDRFGVVSRLSFYEPEELRHILSQAAKKLGTAIHPTALTELSRRGRGTPRVALRLLKRVRDVAQVEGTGEITQDILSRSLSLLEVDTVGLDSSDRRLLTTIIDKFAGGPVGIETLAAALSEDIGTVEEVLEPYLMQIGFLKRTPRGRVVTPEALRHLKRPVPTSTSHQLQL
jgi:Holliday junction DNA helicase RuvB